jgi:hypothetical protein
MRRTCLIVTIVVGLGLAADSLIASTFLSAEFKEVVSAASTIVRGRVNEVRAYRSVSGDVESAVTIAVETTLKGSTQTFVSMRLPGGTIGRYRTVMMGVPVMQVGERAVFFLKTAPDNSLWPVGLAQGIYRVTSPAAGAPGAVPMVYAPVLPGVTTNTTGVVVRGDVRRKSLPVTEFESLVRLLLAQGAR